MEKQGPGALLLPGSGSSGLNLGSVSSGASCCESRMGPLGGAGLAFQGGLKLVLLLSPP